MKKEEYYMIREYNQYSLCKHLKQLIIGMAKKLGKSSTNTKERNEYQFYFQKKAQVSCDIL